MCTISRDDVLLHADFALAGVFWFFFWFLGRFRLSAFDPWETGFGVVHCCTWCCIFWFRQYSLCLCTIAHFPKKMYISSFWIRDENMNYDQLINSSTGPMHSSTLICIHNLPYGGLYGGCTWWAFHISTLHLHSLRVQSRKWNIRPETSTGSFQRLHISPITIIPYTHLVSATWTPHADRVCCTVHIDRSKPNKVAVEILYCIKNVESNTSPRSRNQHGLHGTLPIGGTNTRPIRDLQFTKSLLNYVLVQVTYKCIDFNPDCVPWAFYNLYIAMKSAMNSEKTRKIRPESTSMTPWLRRWPNKPWNKPDTQIPGW